MNHRTNRTDRTRARREGLIVAAALVLVVAAVIAAVIAVVALVRWDGSGYCTNTIHGETVLVQCHPEPPEDAR